MAQKKKSRRSYNAIRELNEQQKRKQEIKRVADRWEKEQPSYEYLAEQLIDLFYKYKGDIGPLSRGRKEAAKNTNALKKNHSSDAIQKFQELADQYWSKKPNASKRSVARWIIKRNNTPLKPNGIRYNEEYIASCIMRSNK